MAQQQPTKRELRKQRQVEKQQRRERAQKKQQRKRMTMWGIALILIVVVMFAVTQSGGDGGSSDNTTHPTFIQENDNIKGGVDALTTLIEYSDFECPACASYFPIVTQLNEDFGDQLKIVYRHYPLVQIHAQADLAARAAEAAGVQGKFWEMHDKLFETQAEWAGPRSAEDFFIGLAEDLELDVEQFKTDLKSSEIRDKISDDRRSGNRLNVSSTPTFYLNGKKISNPRSYDEFRQLVSTAVSETPSVVPVPDSEDNETATSTSETATSSDSLVGEEHDDSMMSDDSHSGEICENLCGDGQCQEIVCLGEGCPCAESVDTCAQDCSL